MSSETIHALILVVEDEKNIADLQRMYLQKAGFGVHCVADGESALKAIRDLKPAAVVLDIGIPGIDGIDVCRALRAEGNWIPILFCTARDDEIDRVLGLEMGADDYITKPCPPRVLLARIRARLRVHDHQTIQMGDITIDVKGQRVLRNGEEVALTKTEFQLLKYLATNPGTVFSRDRLLRDVWKHGHVADTRLVNVHVQRLRSKIERDPEHPEIVLSVRGVGYKAGFPSAS